MNAYGSLGNIYSLFGSGQEIPDWLKKQSQAYSESQQLVDQNGKPFVQLGIDPSQMGGKNGTLIDPSKVRYDPELGYVTDPENFKGADPLPFYKDPLFYAWAGLTGAGLGAQGLFGGFGGGSEAGGLGESGAFDMGGSSGFGGSTPLASGPADSYWGMLGDSGQVASDAGGGLFDTLPDFQMDPSFMPEMQMSPFSAADGLPGMTGMGSQGLLGRIGSMIANNPEAAMRLGLGGASLLSALTGSGNGSGGGSGGGGGLPWQNGPLPNFTPWQFQFQPNQQNFQPVPFMGGY